MDSGVVLAKPETLSQISRDIGQVLFASLVVTPFLSEAFNVALIIFGLVLSSSAWVMSLLLAKE